MTDAPRFEMGHIGLYVTDLDRMTDFYRRVLGFKITDGGPFGEMRMAFLSRNAGHHHQIVFLTGRPEESYNTINQISFKVSSLDDLRVYHDALLAEGVDGFDPTDHGNAWSIYFRDPEGNRLEVFMDTPWYVQQPRCSARGARLLALRRGDPRDHQGDGSAPRSPSARSRNGARRSRRPLPRGFPIGPAWSDPANSSPRGGEGTPVGAD